MKYPVGTRFVFYDNSELKIVGFEKETNEYSLLSSNCTKVFGERIWILRGQSWGFVKDVEVILPKVEILKEILKKTE